MTESGCAFQAEAEPFPPSSPARSDRPCGSIERSQAFPGESADACKNPAQIDCVIRHRQRVNNAAKAAAETADKPCPRPPAGRIERGHILKRCAANVSEPPARING